MALTYKDRPLDFWVPAVGTYLTNGTKLVEVVAADKGGVTAHDCTGSLEPESEPISVLIPLVAIADQHWQAVTCSK